jgi:excisionase family DNA binding protein
MNRRLVTIEEVANIYSVSLSTVRRWIRSGKLMSAGQKAGGQWRFDPEIVRQVFEQGLLSGANRAPVYRDEGNPFVELPDWARPITGRWRNALDSVIEEFHPDHVIVNDRRGASIWQLLLLKQYTWGKNLWHSSAMELMEPADLRRMFANQKILLFDEMVQYGRDLSKRRKRLEAIGSEVESFVCIRRRSYAEAGKLVEYQAYVAEDLDEKSFSERATMISQLINISNPPLDVDHLLLKGKLANSFDVTDFLLRLANWGIGYVDQYWNPEEGIKLYSITLDRPQFFNTSTVDNLRKFQIVWNGPCKVRFYINPSTREAFCSFIVFPYMEGTPELWIENQYLNKPSKKRTSGVTNMAKIHLDDNFYVRVYQDICMDLARQLLSDFLSSGAADSIGIAFEAAEQIIDIDNLKATFGPRKGEEFAKKSIQIINNRKLPFRADTSPPPFLYNKSFIDEPKSRDAFNCRIDLLQQVPRKHVSGDYADQENQPISFAELFGKLDQYSFPVVGQVLDYELDWGSLKPLTWSHIRPDVNGEVAKVGRYLYLGEYDPWFDWESKIHDNDDALIRKSLALGPKVVEQFNAKMGQDKIRATHIAKLFSNLKHDWRADAYGPLFYFIEPYKYGPLPKVPRRLPSGGYMEYVDFLVEKDFLREDKEKHGTQTWPVYWPADESNVIWRTLYDNVTDGKTKAYIAGLVHLYATIQDKCTTQRESIRSQKYSLLKDPLIVLASARNDKTAYISGWFEVRDWLDKGKDLVAWLKMVAAKKSRPGEPFMEKALANFAEPSALLYEKIGMYRNLPYLRKQIEDLMGTGEYSAAHILLESVDSEPKIEAHSKYPIRKLEWACGVMRPFSSMTRQILTLCGLATAKREVRKDAHAYLTSLLESCPELQILRTPIENCIKKAENGVLTDDIADCLSKTFKVIFEMLNDQSRIPDPRTPYENDRQGYERRYDLITTLQGISLPEPYAVAAIDHKNFVGLGKLISDYGTSFDEVVAELLKTLKNCAKQAAKACSNVELAGVTGDSVIVAGNDVNQVLACILKLMAAACKSIARNFRELKDHGLLRAGITWREHDLGSEYRGISPGLLAAKIGDRHGAAFGEITISEPIYQRLASEYQRRFRLIDGGESEQGNSYIGSYDSRLDD